MFLTPINKIKDSDKAKIGNEKFSMKTGKKYRIE